MMEDEMRENETMENEPTVAQTAENPATPLPEAPVTEAPKAEETKKPSKKKKTLLIIGIAAAAVLTLAFAALGILKYLNAYENEQRETQWAVEKLQKDESYCKGQELLNNGDYDAAFKIFTELGLYQDSQKLARQAQIEMDCKDVPALIAAGDYGKAARLLAKKGDALKGTEEGAKASALAAEYKAVYNALSAMELEDYIEASAQFEKLDKLAPCFASQAAECAIHSDIQKGNWCHSLAKLYVFANGGTVAADDETYVKIQDAAENGDGETLLSLVNVTDEKQVELKDLAEKGLRYDKAQELYDNNDFAGAIAIYEELGSFLDSEKLLADTKKEYEECEKVYQDALKLYKAKKFYSAREVFEQISGYKDSAKKAASCKQSLPKNGGLKKNSGNIKLTIHAPKGKESVLVRVYSSGKLSSQVFIRPGKKASIKVKKGNNTIKVGYGTEWYGSELFGPEGDYVQLMNGSSPNFKFSGGYAYTIKLMVTSNGNVGSQGIDPGDM